MKILPCVQCGYCCSVAPCGFGQWDGEKCRYLIPTKNEAGVKIYECEKYDQIKKMPGWEISPAFGQGCSSSLGNVRRREIIERSKK